jgi:hypothetical protein
LFVGAAGAERFWCLRVATGLPVLAAWKSGGAAPRIGELGRSRASWNGLIPSRRLADEALTTPLAADAPIDLPVVWPNIASRMIAGLIAAPSKTAKMTPALKTMTREQKL